MWGPPLREEEEEGPSSTGGDRLILLENALVQGGLGAGLGK